MGQYSRDSTRLAVSVPDSRVKPLKARIAVYFYDKALLPRIFAALSKVPDATMTVMPVKKYHQSLRRSPGGDGYATYEHYRMKIYKAVLTLKQIHQMQKVLQRLDIQGIYVDARIA